VHATGRIEIKKDGSVVGFDDGADHESKTARTQKFHRIDRSAVKEPEQNVSARGRLRRRGCAAPKSI